MTAPVLLLVSTTPGSRYCIITWPFQDLLQYHYALPITGAGFPGESSKGKNNVLALAASAQYFKLPTILTTSFESGPNGPLVPELKDIFPHAPYIPRPGNINAWDNEDFVNAVHQTGRKQLIIAGVVTEVCVAFPALSALEAGYDVFVVTDASGTFNGDPSRGVDTHGNGGGTDR